MALSLSGFFKKNVDDPKAIQPDANKLNEPKPADLPVEEPKTGIDKFQEILDNAKKARETAAATGEPKAQPITANSLLTPENVEKLKGSVDFTKAITAETMAKLAEGEPAAIMQAMQEMSSQAYITALQQATMLADSADSAGAASSDDIEARVASAIKSSKIEDAIPGYDNPVIKLGVEALKNELTTANPDATPAEIATHVQEFVAELHTQINPPTSDEETGSDDTSESTNWLEYAN